MYEMKPEYYIGIDMIDEEHKQIFKYADEAYELLHDEFTVDKYDKVDVILEKLRDYTVKHFTDEEWRAAKGEIKLAPQLCDKCEEKRSKSE